ncbi:hypothetical protein BGZ65_010144, partial [Modicella reniformis]
MYNSVLDLASDSEMNQIAAVKDHPFAFSKTYGPFGEIDDDDLDLSVTFLDDLEEQEE